MFVTKFKAFKKYSICAYLCVFFLYTNCDNPPEVNNVNPQPNQLTLDLSAQVKFGLDIYNKNGELLNPRSSDGNTVKYAYGTDWTVGFYPGILWQMFQISKDPVFKDAASNYTWNLKSLENVSNTHDLGFMVNNSFGKAYEITNEEKYKEVLIKSANNLASRYNPNVKSLRSWDWGWWTFPVIIDNMMNLELLFRAYQLTGNKMYYDIAVSHATTTMSNHFRSDFSSYHLVDYNSQTGNIISKETFQGYGNESDWARGQAWGLYGFVVCYRFTNNASFLDFSEKIAAFLLNHPNMSLDLIPYWDLKDPMIPNTYKDASAAAIMASAFAELYTYTKNDLYRLSAIKIVDRLLENDYFSEYGTNHGFILKHSVGNKPSASEVDVSINYADYYFIEALKRLNYLN